MVKDLTSRFMSLYEQKHSSGDEEKAYMIECDNLFVERKLPDHIDTFLSKVTNLHQRLQLLKDLIADLEKKQSEILCEAIPDKLIHEEYNQLIDTIKEMSEYFNKDIKQLRTDTMRLNKYSIVTTEEKIKRDQVNVLVMLFQDVMVEYNQVQMDHREKCKARIKRQLEISERTIDNEELENMLEDGRLEVFHKEIVFDDINKAGQVLKIVESRHSDILKLEQSIQDLFQIFQEIAILVESQGDLVDNIESHVEETKHTLDKIKKDIKIAKKYKSRGIFSFCCPTFLRKSMCCTIL